MTPVSEATILTFTKTMAKRLGLRFVRLSLRPGVETGWPDVIVLDRIGSKGRVLWIETKAPGQKLRPIQEHRRQEIVSRGGAYCKPDNVEAVERCLKDFARG